MFGSRSSSFALLPALTLSLLLPSGCGSKSEDKGPPPAATPAEAKAGDAKGPEQAEKKDAPDAAPFAFNLPKGLSTPPVVPEDNPMSAEKVKLGHQLFMDKRLSGDGSRSCYSCHQNELGNADGRKLALGAGDKPLTRNTPTIWNVAYHAALYWDGRAPSLEKQMLGAWKGGNMGVGAEGLDAKAAEIGALKEYKAAFAAVFGLEEGAKVSPMQVAQAVSAYERTLLCGDTAYDRNELDEAAKRGWELFRGKASCTTCHNGELFSDGQFHNVGVGFDAQGKPIAAEPDLGRGKITKQDADAYRFRTPTLRNVAKTGPYFHDGSAASLEDAVRYMARGGEAKTPGLDEKLRDVGLSDAEISDIVAFLRSLDCPGSLEVIGDQNVAGIPETVPSAG